MNYQSELKEIRWRGEEVSAAREIEKLQTPNTRLQRNIQLQIRRDVGRI